MSGSFSGLEEPLFDRPDEEASQGDGAEAVDHLTQDVTGAQFSDRARRGDSLPVRF